MDDKNTMETLLNLIKGSSDLLLHGTIESSTENVNQTFHNALCEALKLQHCIYKKMESKGWYQVQQAEQQKIDQAKQKASSNQ